ncbi:hypothetical protein ACMDCR_28205 [Labrys okinawensis]|uniref:hypothetical protein n=1 Tax=Labrys okinawensis TaxID=346911 RepID=UPI0039BC5C2E
MSLEMRGFLLPRLIGLIALLIAQACVDRLKAQDDPAEYCLSHQTEDRCIIFYGATSPFYSRSGNVGTDQAGGVPGNSLYKIFIHTGHGDGNNGGGDDVSELVKALQGAGYFIGGIDQNYDESGPGVDYFTLRDEVIAADVAAIVDDVLPDPKHLLVPRLQKTGNPPGYLGLWLHGGNSRAQECSRNRQIQISIAYAASRDPQMLAAGLRSSCFQVPKPRAFTAPHIVDPHNPGTTYIIPAIVLGRKLGLQARDDIENDVVGIAQKFLPPSISGLHPNDTSSPGIFAGGEGPVSSDVVIYLF